MPAISKDEFIDAISGMTVLEVTELVKAMEEKFGVSAQAAVAAAPAAAGGDAQAGAAAEEQTAFAVQLTAIGDNKISVIQAVRALTKLGLKESKELVEKTPTPVMEDVSKEDADAALAQLEKAGASVEIK